MGWQRLCSAQEVATGGLTGIEIQGVKVLVTRVGDAFVAFPPLCPHMAEPLEISGVCADGMLTCTKHIWQWELQSGEPGIRRIAVGGYSIRVIGLRRRRNDIPESLVGRSVNPRSRK